MLTSYDEERRPVAVRNGRQALLRTDLEARFGIKTEANHNAVEQMQDVPALLLRYQYGNANSQEAGAGFVDHLRGQPGTRFPHAWIEKEGKRISTLDLFGNGYVVLQRPSYRDQPDLAAKPTQRMGQRTYKAGFDFRFCESGVS